MPATVADYVLTRLAEQRVDTLFGVPALYCAPLFDAAPQHGIRAVVTASDLEAGYAADGYARTRGLGAVAVSYGVGTLSMINAIAGAHLERSPVVVVNGGPTARHLNNLANLDVVFSHSTGRPDTDRAAFALVTAGAARAGRASEVPAVVDAAITTAVVRKRPVYVEIGQDLWGASCPAPTAPLTPRPSPVGGEATLAASVVQQIRAATAPLVLVGVEVQRYGLADQVAEIIARLGVRWSTALLGKSVLAEQGAGWVGVFDPPHLSPAVTQAVDRADLIVILGAVFPAGWAPLLTSSVGRIVSAYDGAVRVRGGPRQPAEIGAFVAGLRTAALAGPARTGPPAVVPAVPPPASGPLTYQQVFDRLGAALDEKWLTIPDTFLGTFPAADLPMTGRDAFLSSAAWASIGHSVAAAVGASFGSRRRPLVVCGDGGFRMTAQALSTLARYRRNPVVIVLDNGLYAYEQHLIDRSYFTTPGASPKPYAVLDRWDYGKLAAGLGVSLARAVTTAAEFDAALAAATAAAGPALIAARLDPRSRPDGLT